MFKQLADIAPSLREDIKAGKQVFVCKHETRDIMEEIKPLNPHIGTVLGSVMTATKSCPTSCDHYVVIVDH